MKYKPYKYLALTSNNTLYCPHKEDDGRKRSYWYFRGNSIKSIRNRVFHEIKMGYVTGSYVIIDAETHDLVWSMVRSYPDANEWVQDQDDFGPDSTVKDFLDVASKY